MDDDARRQWLEHLAGYPNQVALDNAGKILARCPRELKVRDISIDAMGGLVLEVVLDGQPAEPPPQRWAEYDCLNSGSVLLVLEDAAWRETRETA